MTIGEKIQNYRKKLGWSQEQLAGKLGVSVSTVGMIETDKRNVKDSIKYQLCTLFNISIAELMGDTEINFNFLRSKIIAIFLQYKIKEDKFVSVKKEVLDLIETGKYLEFTKIKILKETKDIIKCILIFSRSSSYINKFGSEDAFIQKYKKEILEVLNSIKYNDLEFNSFLTVVPQHNFYTPEPSIKKNPYEETDKYIGIKIAFDKMIPKYEKGNIAIVQKAQEFINGQDVCFKNKILYDIGRIFIKDNIVAINYFNTNYSTQFFKLEEFKKLYIGVVISTRLYN